MPAILAAWAAELCDLIYYQMSSQSSILYSVRQLLPRPGGYVNGAARVLDGPLH
jgi:hypothetical protein